MEEKEIREQTEGAAQDAPQDTVMDKNTILEKSRKENQKGDERYLQVYRQSAQLGMSVGILVCGLLNLLFMVLTDQYFVIMYVTNTVMLSMWLATYVSLAAKCKRRMDIVLAIFFGVFLLVFLVLLVLSAVMGKLF